ncbi:LysR family transcriptional regulator [Vibrio sp. HN007]|uniref:LysR family transcriptional regulator n=1 Tax=Vibrio iocasae TaxID=3098914 RepID=UPI0035D4A29D
MRHLKAFHIFHIAAESNSYSEAAEKLHITHGAVSKQVKLLEEHLSQPLFYKKGRGMGLTQEGELLKQYTDVAFDALNTGINKLRKLHGNHLEVSCEPTLTMRWLMPRLSGFYQISGVDVRLSTAGGPVNLHESELSMAIRRDDFEIPAYYGVHRLVEEWVGPVMSPEYWGKIRNNVSDITLLHSKTRPEAWRNWSLGSGSGIDQNEYNQSFDHFYFCIQAAADGLGAAIGSYPLVVDDLKNGRLVAPFGFIRSGHNYVLIRQSEEIDAKELQFQQWLEKHLSRCIPNL